MRSETKKNDIKEKKTINKININKQQKRQQKHYAEMKEVNRSHLINTNTHTHVKTVTT